MTGVSGAVHWDVGDTGTQKIIFHIVPLRTNYYIYISYIFLHFYVNESGALAK